MAIPTTSSSDPILETRFFWDRYKREIAVVVGILVAAGIGYAAYRYFEERRETDAATALSSARTADDYRRVISDYPKSPAAASAYLLAADELRKKKDFPGANAQLQQFVDKFPNHSMATTARIAMASNVEAMGRADEALEMYRKIAASYPQDFLAPLAMLSQVHLLQAKGQTDEARKICEIVMTQYRESYLGAEAGRMLRTLKPPQSSAPKLPVPPAALLAPAPQPSALPPQPR